MTSFWRPPNLAAACTPYAAVTTCQSQSFVFLQLIVSLFSRSEDGPSTANSDFPGEAEAFFDNYENRAEEKEEVFDFIIVGAGSAGCVLANRLSAIKQWKVLLLEAGDEEPKVADVPAFAPVLQRSSIDWGFLTQPQPRCCRARAQGRCSWPRGKVMGGSSTINYMTYLRGGPKDYDEWARLGNEGWSYRDVLPYFVRMERNLNIDQVGEEFHGTEGEVSVSYFPYRDQNVNLLLEALRELGLDIFDQNGERQVGASVAQTFSENGLRVSSNAAFVRPIRRNRKNLVLKTNSLVLRVLIDPRTKTAFGVEYVRDGRLLRAVARKEVIVSAGPIMSPKLLMVSGIGPADHLRELNIPVVRDSAVGFNLHDHPTLDGVVIALSNLTATTVSNEEQRAEVYRYHKTHYGPLASTATLQVNAFVQTKYEKELDRPDIQFSLDTVNVGNFFTDPILTSETSIGPLSFYNGIMIRPILIAPRSRGFIRLNESDPIFGYPIIFSSLFEDEEDVARVVEGIRQGVNIVRTKSMRNVGASLVTVPLPACRNYEFDSYQYWRCVCFSYTTTLYHPVGTCKMGPREDKTAVVDPKLNVYGIRRLRVIDSSVMPIVVRANINAATMMIAERGADFIKNYWRKFEKGELIFENFDINLD